jgi:ribosomal protein L20A (L18A)
MEKANQDVVKTYRVTGDMTLTNRKKTKFVQDVRATKMNAAVFKVMENLGSRHKVKTNMIKIKEVKEINAEESEDMLIQQLGAEE